MIDDTLVENLNGRVLQLTVVLDVGYHTLCLTLLLLVLKNRSKVVLHRVLYLAAQDHIDQPCLNIQMVLLPDVFNETYVRKIVFLADLIAFEGLLEKEFLPLVTVLHERGNCVKDHLFRFSLLLLTFLGCFFYHLVGHPVLRRGLVMQRSRQCRLS